MIYFFATLKILYFMSSLHRIKLSLMNTILCSGTFLKENRSSEVQILSWFLLHNNAISVTLLKFLEKKKKRVIQQISHPLLFIFVELFFISEIQTGHKRLVLWQYCITRSHEEGHSGNSGKWHKNGIRALIQHTQQCINAVGMYLN